MNSVVLKITARIGFTITDLMNDDWTNLRGLKWGLFPPNRRGSSDQIPMLVQSGKKTMEFKGKKGVWIAHSKADLTKRQFTLQLMLFYESFDGEERVMPFIKPLLVFKAQPEGYDKDNKDWTGDVTKAPGLSRSELESYDPRCDVAFSKKAWMSKQVCEYDVQRILDNIGDEYILLQLDGYESYLNAIKKVDVDGHIRQLVSPEIVLTCLQQLIRNLGVS